MPGYYVGPSWPPHIADYDYILTLCPSDLAWEFLRRNPGYQRAYRLSRRGWHRPRRLRSGHLLSRIRRLTPRAITWGLHPFRRSGPASAQSSSLLADKSRCSTPRGSLRPPVRRRVGRSVSAQSVLRNKRHCRARSRGKRHPSRLGQSSHATPSWLPRIRGAGRHHLPGWRTSKPFNSGSQLRHPRRASPLPPLQGAPLT
jgi:Proteobacterial transcriptional regulator-like domain